MYESVLHFTIGGANKSGERIPGVWVFKMKLFIASGLSGNLADLEYTAEALYSGIGDLGAHIE